MNRNLLEQMAYRTGGTFTVMQSGAGLTAEIASKANLIPREQVNTSEIEVWNWGTMVTIILFLLSLEWFLRKRMGML
jgi:hypothetical protein